MAHYPIDHSDTPIRLFKSDFMEFFTHINPWVIVIFWTPIAAWLLITSIQLTNGISILRVAAGFLVGLFVWTLTEYTLHRFLFHYPPKTPRQEKIFFLFHGVHHAQPQCKTRLVMPLVLSIPMAAIFYGIFYFLFVYLLGADVWFFSAFSGFLVGYLIYDLTHYATHHFPMRSGYLKFIKRYHMQHHYKTPNQRYGVSSPLWDIIFQTRPLD
jgi:sterol desaturase/sphingolipid hydroxylase (fatty acid hydroxylase superfamily)